MLCDLMKMERVTYLRNRDYPHVKIGELQRVGTAPPDSSDLPPGVKRLPIPTSRFSMTDLKDRQGSVLSITSAGEDVLAAWAELGGNDNIKTKPKVRPSGPLSQIMNS